MNIFNFQIKETSISILIICTSALIMLLGNITFYTHVLKIYPLNIDNFLFLISLAVVFGGITVFLLSLICYKYTVKPILIGLLLISSSAAYFMDTYNIIIDTSMIDNILNTDTGELIDLLSVGQFLYLFFLGALPSIIIYKINIVSLTAKQAVIARLQLITLSATAVIVTIVLLSNFYASFFREHKTIRFYANPSYFIFSTVKYTEKFFEGVNLPLEPIATDAVRIPTNNDRKLIILVVGETARSDHFSLNGYSKITNPSLAKDDVFSFTNFWSCGTATAISVPCMFSSLDRSSYSKSAANAKENVLDILQRTGVNIIWLDNNSSSKGVADRIQYEDYKYANKNPVCDIECRDVGMLKNLQAYIDKHSKGDILIILHQMGNHGPAYYKRYTKAFEVFTPVCKTNQLENCSKKEISNTYDNAILYTDYFLSETISFLKNNDDNFATTMFYLSDHGESLGENNFYLHGLPYLFAPEAQKKVPAILWFGKKTLPTINIKSLTSNIHHEYSHDNLFHTLLGMLNVKTSIYDKSMNIVPRYEFDSPPKIQH